MRTKRAKKGQEGPDIAKSTKLTNSRQGQHLYSFSGRLRKAPGENPALPPRKDMNSDSPALLTGFMMRSFIQESESARLFIGDIGVCMEEAMLEALSR
jgi:hypothetical protein